MKTRTCIRCGKEYETWGGTRRHCFECYPAGLTPSQQHTLLRKFEREQNPVFETCPNCGKKWEVPYGIVNKKYCPDCIPYDADKNEQTRLIKTFAKRKALNKVGSECYLCSYNKYQSALEFHHLDDETKDYNIANRFSSADITQLENELDKCIVLCSNCHRALHAGELDITIEELKKKVMEDKV